MGLEYLHDLHRFADGGLQLTVPPDVVPPAQYSHLTNARSVLEGRLETRGGIAQIANIGTNPVHSIFRLNQPSPSAVSERLFGSGASLYSAPFPGGNVPVVLAGPSFDGSPLSIMAFRFDGDPQMWGLIANSGGMWKRKNMYTQPLGVAPPTVGPSASAGAAGNLNGSYDWIYTYFNPITLTESNPSPFMVTPPAPPTFTTFTNPSPLTPGENAFSNPGNAIDGNTSTFAQGSGSSGAPFNRSSCSWQGATGVATFNVTVSVLHSAAITDSNASVIIYYSLDGGTTRSFLFSSLGSGYGQRTDTFNITAGQDLTKVVVYGFTTSAAAGKSVTLNIYEIFFTLGAAAGQIALTNQIGKVCVTAPPAGFQGTTIGLYRRGGTLNDAYRLIGYFPAASLSQGTCGAGSLEIDDNNTDASITAQATITTDNNVPVSSIAAQASLKAIWGFSGRVFGCGDPSRPDCAYWCKRGNADAWAPYAFIVVGNAGDEIMNGLEYNLRCYAWGRERLYQLIETGANVLALSGLTNIATTSFTPSGTPCRRGLKGRWAFCVGAKGIYFVAKDGIFVTDGGAEQSIIDPALRPLFPVQNTPGQDVEGYLAPDLTQEDALRLAYHNGEVWFDYTSVTGAVRQRMIYDEVKNRWRAESYANAMQMAYSEPETTSSLLMGDIIGNIKQGSSTLEGNVSVAVRTGAFDQGQSLNLKEYGNVLFDLDPNGTNVTITPYINNEAVPEAAIIVSGIGRQTVPLSLSDIYGRNISFDIQWTATPTTLPVLYQFDILYRLEPASLQHWEAPGLSLGQGYGHAKEVYVTLRSNANVTMTMTIDNGAPIVFTLNTTAGNKQKIFLRLSANKGKLYKFAFDSTADFRLYREECELRAKPWGKTEYGIIPLFGAESTSVQSVDEAIQILSGALKTQ